MLCHIFYFVPVNFWAVLGLSLSLSLSSPTPAMLCLFSLLILLLSVSKAGSHGNCCMAVCLCLADFGAGPAAWRRSVSVPPTVHVVQPSAEPVEARRTEEGTCVYILILLLLIRRRPGHGCIFRSVSVRILVILSRLNLIRVTEISRCFWWSFPPLIPCGVPLGCDNRIITAFDNHRVCKNLKNTLWETEQKI